MMSIGFSDIKAWEQGHQKQSYSINKIKCYIYLIKAKVLKKSQMGVNVGCPEILSFGGEI